MNLRKNVQLIAIYRVTHQVEPDLPLISKQKSSILARQNGTFVFWSIGGLAQPDVSPCIAISMYVLRLGMKKAVIY